MAAATLTPSPLFIPATWEGDHFKVLDETLLPGRVEYIRIHSVAEALQVVKEMRTRAFGQVLSFLYATILDSRQQRERDADQIPRRLLQLAEAFARVRPTFSFSSVACSLAESLGEPPGSPAQEWFEAAVHEFAAHTLAARAARARRAAELLPSPCRLLTHCNVSGELVEVARWCGEMEKPIAVIATETRPYFQGSRLTAWELSRAGIDVTLVPDCAAAGLMARGMANAVLVGSDRVGQNGDIVNKVGTYSLAVVARRYDIPFYAFVQDPRALARGDDAVIEERPVSELFTFQGSSCAPQGLRGRYPAFDVTPAGLITRLIHFSGVYSPQTFRQRFSSETSPAPQKAKGGERFVLLYGFPGSQSYRYLAHMLATHQADSILIPEMRPGLWGVRVLARALLEQGLPVTVVADNMIGTFLRQQAVSVLCLFYDVLSSEGAVGPCGFLFAAILAAAHDVPLELQKGAAAAGAQLDKDASTFMGQRVAPEGVLVAAVESEVVPWSMLNRAVEKVP
jgi:methylthioribose-1-phosphate isomerase